jgi:hypothetical protein
MPGRGGFAAITDEDAALLLAAGDGDAAYDLKEEILKADRHRFYCSMDKAWFELARCLEIEDDPLWEAIVGEPISVSSHQVYLYLKPPALVREIATALAPLDEAWLREWWEMVEDHDSDWEYTLRYLRSMQGFYVNAANAGLSVIFSCT